MVAIIAKQTIVAAPPTMTLPRCADARRCAPVSASPFMSAFNIAFTPLPPKRRRLGSAAIDLCYVAAGRMDGFWEAQLNAWDTRAGALIVEESGGRVTGMDGGPWNPANGHILASNGILHEAMLEILAASR